MSIQSHLEVSKRIIKKLFDFGESQSLDDETEFFPILKVVISATVETCKSEFEKQEMERHLMEYAQQIYKSLWIKHAREVEDDIDEVHEVEEAINYFNKLYQSIEI